MNSVYIINIERAVLSSILFSPNLMDDFVNILSPVDFYLPAHNIIYDTMLKLYHQETPIDEEFIRQRLDKKDVDDSVFIEILSANPISDTSAYVKEIIDLSTKRKLVNLATTIKKLTIEEEVKADDAIDTIQSELDTIAANKIKDEFKPLSQEVLEFEETFKELSQNKTPIGIQTGIKQFENRLIFEPADLVVVGARPSMGKTSKLLTMIKYWIYNDIGVLFDSLEMPTQKILRRMVANINQESLNDLKKGYVKDLDKYNKTMHFLKTTKNLIVHDKSYVPISYLKAKAKNILRKNPHIKVWCIDHLKYVKSKGINRALEVSEITKELKAIAKEFGIVVILLSQLRRLDNKATMFRPQLTDLRDSGAVEEDADIIIFPHRESYYKRTMKNQKEEPVNDAELIVAKNRDGESFTVKTQFNGPTNTFGDFIQVSYTNDSGDIVNETEQMADTSAFEIMMD